MSTSTCCVWMFGSLKQKYQNFPKAKNTIEDKNIATLLANGVSDSSRKGKEILKFQVSFQSSALVVLSHPMSFDPYVRFCEIFSGKGLLFNYSHQFMQFFLLHILQYLLIFC